VFSTTYRQFVADSSDLVFGVSVGKIAGKISEFLGTGLLNDGQFGRLALLQAGSDNDNSTKRTSVEF
jgi:hypothetical protein